MSRTKVKVQKNNRIPEIDMIRGIAIILMVLYHLFFDLHSLNIFSLPMINTPYWELSQQVIAGIFLTLVGISLYISHSRIEKSKSKSEIIKKYLWRGTKIFFWGMVLTVISCLFINPETYIRFGILHLIGISIIMLIPFLWNQKFIYPIGIIILLAGSIFTQFNCSGPEHILLGCTSPGFASIDYFPLLPWSGLVFLGFWLAKTKLPLKYSKPRNKINLLELMGQKSLLIYLVHQPIIYFILLAFAR